MMAFVATAYCHGSRTAAGTRVNEGIVAADPAVLPLGTIIRIQDSRGDSNRGLKARHDGIYTVMDTGPKVLGRRVDLYMHDCREAVRFGRRSVKVSVVQTDTTLAR